MHVVTTILLAAVLGSVAGSQEPTPRATSSGGRLSPEQRAFQVMAYELVLDLDPEERSIAGYVIVTVRHAEPVTRLVLDLDSPFQVSAVQLLRPIPRTLEFERTPTQIAVKLPRELPAAGELRLQIDYAGQPRVAPRPPWVGGFVWEETQGGQPWVSVACQLDGADLWWPNIDHPLAEPRRVDIKVTVPKPLVVASNGTLQSVTSSRAGYSTFHWRSSNPINPYNVTLNAAPYRRISREYTSLAGQRFPVVYWVLPENLQRGNVLFGQILKQLRFLEETIGPYPFRNEKYGVAEVPYLGMEHQTIVAYGNQYRDNEFGFDWLHLHELAHEWWGNLVTASDWSDYWLHEGFASYMEALYAEKSSGKDALKRYMAGFRKRIGNRTPLAPRQSRTSVEKYFQPPDYQTSDGDVNFKGVWVLHTLRYLVGDEVFFRALRRFAYPTVEHEQALDGSQCRFATSDDFRKLVEGLAGRDLFWFFEVYLRQPGLPKLRVEHHPGSLSLRWNAPRGLPFPMPVEIQIGDEVRRIEVPPAGASVAIPAGISVVVDPEQRILRAAPPAE